ncbi:MAG: hypothetical protein ACFE9R_03895 [Candidatus Hermodarchaeota archaeon]
MEIDSNRKTLGKTVENLEPADLIKVRAIITCPNGDYSKKFRNQFPRNQLELFVVAAKVFDFMTCPKCGEILKLDLEFNI